VIRYGAPFIHEFVLSWRKKGHALKGTIRDERGYTMKEKEVRERTTHSDFMSPNMRKKLFPGAFLNRQLSLVRGST